jgi:hypothetical protein
LQNESQKAIYETAVFESLIKKSLIKRHNLRNEPLSKVLSFMIQRKIELKKEENYRGNSINSPFQIVNGV